jgi:hypothetical protein
VTASGIGVRRALMRRDSRAVALCHLRLSKVVAIEIGGPVMRCYARALAI